MVALILRYLPEIIAFVVIASVIGYSGNALYQSGRSVERAEWLEKESKREIAQGKLVSAAQEKVELEAKKQYDGLIEVINEQAKLNKKLDDDIAGLNAGRMFVTTKAAKCDSSGLPTTSKSTGDPGGELARENVSELHPDDAKNIRHAYTSAAELANECKIALMLIEKNFDIAN